VVVIMDPDGAKVSSTRIENSPMNLASLWAGCGGPSVMDASMSVKGWFRLVFGVRAVATRNAVPGFVCCDTGSELTANAIRDWCRFSGAGASHIEPRPRCRAVQRMNHPGFGYAGLATQ